MIPNTRRKARQEITNRENHPRRFFSVLLRIGSCFSLFFSVSAPLATSTADTVGADSPTVFPDSFIFVSCIFSGEDIVVDTVLLLLSSLVFVQLSMFYSPGGINHNLTEFIYVCRHLAWVQVLKRSLRLRGVRSLSPDLTSEHLYHFIRHFQDWQYIRASMALRSTRPASLCGPSNAKEMFTCSCSDLKTRPARQSTASALSADRAVYHITGNSTEQMSEEPSKRIFPDPLHEPPFL